ncbi:MAG: two component transcriptional regulator, LuxR family [Bryobacterales bacterium]|nr:two component transcriptional regulator, LuxR family [Bryobacterales bacterium]
MKTINLLLVDDHEMFREGLARTLEREPDLSVVGQCSSTAEALAMLNPRVDMVLLDVDLGDERALGLVDAVRKTSYQGQILVVTAGISGQEAVRLLQAGVNGILHKRHSGQILCESIRKVAAGESCLEEKYLTSLIHSIDRTRPASNPTLTERDRALLRYVLEGLTNREIGTHLQVSEGAVKASLRLLFEKVNVRTRTQLVKVALEQYQDQL